MWTVVVCGRTCVHVRFAMQATMELYNKMHVERKHGLSEGIGNRPGFDSMARLRDRRR